MRNAVIIVILALFAVWLTWLSGGGNEGKIQPTNPQPATEAEAKEPEPKPDTIDVRVEIRPEGGAEYMGNVHAPQIGTKMIDPTGADKTYRFSAEPGSGEVGFALTRLSNSGTVHVTIFANDLVVGETVLDDRQTYNGGTWEIERPV